MFSIFFWSIGCISRNIHNVLNSFLIFSASNENTCQLSRYSSLNLNLVRFLS